jgi:hypothetical protein
MKCSYSTGTGEKLSRDEYERSEIELCSQKKKKKSNGVRTSALKEVRVGKLFVAILVN